MRYSFEVTLQQCTNEILLPPHLSKQRMFIPKELNKFKNLSLIKIN